jgi:hypothetical protein
MNIFLLVLLIIEVIGLFLFLYSIITAEEIDI